MKKWTQKKFPNLKNKLRLANCPTKLAVMECNRQQGKKGRCFHGRNEGEGISRLI
jgi:hypothetical protein